MSKIFSNRNLIIIGVVIAAILVWYFFFSGPAPVPSTDLLQSTPAQSESDELLSDLNQIKSLKLDASIFSNPAFTSLVDSTVVTPPQPTGRSNPFGPLPSFTPAPGAISLPAAQ